MGKKKKAGRKSFKHLFKIENLSNFEIGDYAYCLIPNYLVPYQHVSVSVEITDKKVDHHKDFYWYKVKITEIDESVYFIKTFFPFLRIRSNWGSFAKKEIPDKLHPQTFDSYEEWFEVIKEYEFWTEAFYMFKSKHARKRALVEIANIGIEELLYNIMHISINPNYTSSKNAMFPVNNKTEFWDWVTNKFEKYSELNRTLNVKTLNNTLFEWDDD